MVIKHHAKLYLRLTFFMVFLFILMPFISNHTILASTTKQRIYDFAELLTPEEVEELEILAEKHSKKRQTDFIVLTSKDIGEKSVVKYMEDFYDEKGLGYDKPYGNTVIITINMEERDVHVGGFYKGEKFLDNKRSSLVREEITPSLSKGNYYKAFKSFIETSSKYMRFRPGANPKSYLFNGWIHLLLSLVVGGIVVERMASQSSGKMTVNEGTYRDAANSRVIESRDDYIRTTTTKVKKPENNSSSGGGSSGGGGISSGGHSHSGSSGKF